MRLSMLVPATVAVLMMSIAASAAAPKAAEKEAATLGTTWPYLVSGALTCATLGELPPGVVLKSGPLTVTEKELAAEIEKAPEATRPVLQKNRLFLLDQMATQEILLRLAREEHAKSKNAATSATEEVLIRDYVQSWVKEVSVSDKEIAAFYEQNKEMCGGATLDQAKDSIRPYVLQQKQQDAVNERLRTLGKRVPIVVSARWAGEQAALAMDNPVDKARKSGLPSMIDFGASGCTPCEMMSPILADLKKKFKGRLNVEFVHVREEQILAARYGIQSIPVQVFFDKSGREIFRHTGFFAQAQIEKKLAEMGVK